MALGAGRKRASGFPRKRGPPVSGKASACLIRADMRSVASALAALGAPRPGVDVELAADILFAILGDDSVYRRLTDERGGSDQVYAE